MNEGTHTPAATAAVAARPPRKLGGSHILLAIGAAAMLGGLLLVAADVPAGSYDAAAPGVATSPEGAAAHEYASIVDANLKYLRDNTDDSPGHYIAVQRSISTSEDNVAAIAASTQKLHAAIQQMDTAVDRLHAISRGMAGDLGDMRVHTDRANASLALLESRIQELSGLLGQMGAETDGLAKQLRLVERTSRAIADGDLPRAVALTRQLNRTLPAEVPAVKLTMEAPQ